MADENLVSQPPLMTPISDGSGILSKAWSIWFRDLYRRVAFKGGNAIDDLEGGLSDLGIDTLMATGPQLQEIEDLIDEAIQWVPEETDNDVGEVGPFPVIAKETEIISINADFTTTGDQILICSNAGQITVTLNSNPDDGEELHIKRRSTGPVIVSGLIDGNSSMTILSRYDSAHLVFTLGANEWSII